MKRLILTTGGTGGHIFPALAVAECVRAQYPDCRILFVGSAHGPEKELAVKAGLEFAALPAQGVVGRGLKSLSMLVWLGRSLFKAWQLLRRERPDAVLGLGGYAGFSCPLAAALMGIPSAIHEQNSVAGVTNKVLARFVDRVLVSFEHVRGLEKAGAKTVLTGNPIRESIRQLREQRKVPGRNVLIVGGSQGASALNQIMLRELDQFRHLDLHIWHQTGSRDFELVSEQYAVRNPKARATAFIDDMQAAYSFADLIICRAGATTIAELTAAGKPSILVPFPYATHDHQLINARSVADKGGALVMQQSQLESVSLATAVGDLFQMPERLAVMGRAARDMGLPDAGERVVAELEKLVQEKRGTLR